MNPIPTSVRGRMLLRSFSIQGSWNYETLIGTGFGYTILPALRHLYGSDERELSCALRRHLELFNSHPYLATVAVGAVSRLEADRVEPHVAERFKTALRGSLGSIGDRLFWSTWRPMSVLVGMVLFLAGAAWWAAITTFLLVYNVMHLTVRAHGLRLGGEAGLDVGRRLRALPIQQVIDRGSQAACFLVGVAVVLTVAPIARDPLALVAALLAVAAGFTLGLRTRDAMAALLVGVTAVAILLGMTGYGA